MKAIIQIDVPDFQIGQEVSIYFKDTMTIKGIVEESKVDPCDRLKLDGMLEDAYEHGYEQARHDYEVQPCNAVSREAVKKLYCDICMDKNICYRNKENCEELDLFDKLPPVTPKSKWLYRLEAIDPNNGLWYNTKNEYVWGCKDCKGEAKNLPMGYDERYHIDGKNWFSSCSNKEDLLHWYSKEDAKYLIDNGFVFTRYLAKDYHEFEMETVFLKETAKAREEISFEDLFN